jgi:soluble lytic murein transglycosylase-like protein
MKAILIISLFAIAYVAIVKPPTMNVPTTPMGFTTLQTEAYNDAVEGGINPNYFVRQINQESGFNPRAYNSVSGASGIAQFIPSTAYSWGVDVWDPHSSLRGAVRYMKYYQDTYGSYRAALIAYNCGPGCIGRPLPQETIDYINIIMQ